MVDILEFYNDDIFTVSFQEEKCIYNTNKEFPILEITFVGKEDNQIKYKINKKVDYKEYADDELIIRSYAKNSWMIRHTKELQPFLSSQENNSSDDEEIPNFPEDINITIRHIPDSRPTIGFQHNISIVSGIEFQRQ